VRGTPGRGRGDGSGGGDFCISSTALAQSQASRTTARSSLHRNFVIPAAVSASSSVLWIRRKAKWKFSFFYSGSRSNSPNGVAWCGLEQRSVRQRGICAGWVPLPCPPGEGRVSHGSSGSGTAAPRCPR